MKRKIDLCRLPLYNTAGEGKSHASPGGNTSTPLCRIQIKCFLWVQFSFVTVLSPGFLRPFCNSLELTLKGLPLPLGSFYFNLWNSLPQSSTSDLCLNVKIKIKNWDNYATALYRKENKQSKTKALGKLSQEVLGKHLLCFSDPEDCLTCYLLGTELPHVAGLSHHLTSCLLRLHLFQQDEDGIRNFSRFDA